ncbi:hypothetical protein DIU31_001330 [Mucilaginibacter rubeus]|uniref:Uncharacterized protein n=1 Tax=Mucilaginibacter rubeus TaxID=2027860 RepID=A0AAE6MG75_9SPHI|nr:MULTISPECIES: hypothetical protein [Mucilaginibacter]QEM02226.1 hypothetical protein DIU31_001330 [Mucilaginibacter rubeus]QEM14852.1 hypothetical protein DIU38_001355 [Mucilaginibacter gossypii]QTE42436.1 hypothetical protein J3L19_26460 [Mucilaginibacter rubeus]QTE49039.1 hypothetical protein J3L21_26435 [Mucilaginibacter rubeus]QTE54137.1 hypothetical protein J3L23_18060 [Mucilaginibacter rubeus]
MLSQIFSDFANEFKLLDYLPTHSQLLMRSMRSRQREYNIDIIFKGVRTLIIDSVFEGLEISLSDENQNIKLIEDHGFVVNHNYKVFLLENGSGQKHFINAMAFGIFHNKLDILETSLGRYDWGELNDEMVLWYK